MRSEPQTFNRETLKYKGLIPAGTWVVVWKTKEPGWIAHRLKKDYRVDSSTLIRESNPEPIESFPVRHFDSCGWKAARTANPDYPVIVFDVRGDHYFPFPCENDPHRTMGPPKEEPLTPAWKRK